MGVHQIHLLCGDGFFDDLGRLPGRWCFAANVVQGVLIIGLELWVLELPGLHLSAAAARHTDHPLTPEP